MKLKCKLFGHKIGDLNDGGYAVCERCLMHSYYQALPKSHPDSMNDSEECFYDDAVLLRPFWKLNCFFDTIKEKIQSKIRYYFEKTQCYYCGEISLQKDYIDYKCPKCGKEDLPF